MKKRIKALLLAVFMIAALVYVDMPDANASGATSGGLSVSAAEVQPGETVTVTMTIPAMDADCGAFDMKMVFDKTAFSIIAIDEGDVGEDVVLTYASIESANQNGWLAPNAYGRIGDTFPLNDGYAFKVTFQPNDGVTGTYEFAIDLDYKFEVYDDRGNILYDAGDDSSFVASKNVSIIIPATDITLDQTSVSLKEGATATLAAALTPENTTDTVVWKSSDDTVATVDQNGKVTAVKKGEATITATARGVSKSCVITVTCAHKNTTVNDKVDPTCTTEGHEAFTKCNDCGVVISGKDEKIDIVAHTLKHVERVEATCDVDGNIEYWQCEVCKAYFADAQAQKNLINAETVISATGHATEGEYSADGTYHWITCGGCGNYFVKDKETHAFTQKTDATYHWNQCTVCGKEVNKENHELDHVTAVAPTCTASGHTEYWHCDGCGKYYSDETATTETTLEATVVASLGHTPSDNWSKDGDNHWKECVRCADANKTDEAAHEFTMKHDETHHWNECTTCGYVKDKAEHTGGAATCLEKATCTVCEAKYSDTSNCNYADVVDAKYLKTAATCTDSEVYYKSCTVCKKAHATDTFTYGDPLGHAYQEVPMVAPTCEATGMAFHYTCTRDNCDLYFDANKVVCTVDSLVIAKQGHDLKHVEAVAETCTTDGNIEYWQCQRSECQRYYSDESATTVITLADTVIEKLGHKPSTEWSTSATEHWKVCDRCKEDAGITSKAAHTFTMKHDATHHWEVCTVCDYAKDKVAHIGGQATCLAKAVCEVEGCQATYGELADCTFDQVVADKYLVSEATCVAKAVYKESCTVCGKAHAANTFETGEVDATNHVGDTEVRAAKDVKCYEEGYTGDTYCLSCDAKVITGSVINKLPHKITEWTVTTEPTTEATGLKTGLCDNEGCTETHTVVMAKLVATGSTVTVSDNTDADVSATVSADSNLTEDVILQVEEVSETLAREEVADITEKAQALANVKEDAKVLSILDMSTILRETTAAGDDVEDVEFEFEGSVEIKFFLSNSIVSSYENLVLVHVNEDGTVVEVPYTIDENNMVTFTATDLNYYTFVGTEKEIVVPGGSGDSGSSGDNGGQGDSGTSGGDAGSNDNASSDEGDKSTSPKTGDVAPVAGLVVAIVVCLGAVVLTRMRRVGR